MGRTGLSMDEYLLEDWARDRVRYVANKTSGHQVKRRWLPTFHLRRPDDLQLRDGRRRHGGWCAPRRRSNKKLGLAAPGCLCTWRLDLHRLRLECHDFVRGPCFWVKDPLWRSRRLLISLFRQKLKKLAHRRVSRHAPHTAWHDLWMFLGSHFATPRLQDCCCFSAFAPTEPPLNRG